MLENPLVQLLINVIIVMLIISVVIVTIILLMELYDKYKKRKDAIKLSAERIIVKMAEDTQKQVATNEALNKQANDLKLVLFELEKEKKELTKELAKLRNEEEPVFDVVEPPEVTTIDFHTFTISELQDIARQLKIVGFSRMKKQKLVDILSNYTLEQIEQIQEQIMNNTHADN